VPETGLAPPQAGTMALKWIAQRLKMGRGPRFSTVWSKRVNRMRK